MIQKLTNGLEDLFIWTDGQTIPTPPPFHQPTHQAQLSTAPTHTPSRTRTHHSLLTTLVRCWTYTLHAIHTFIQSSGDYRIWLFIYLTFTYKMYAVSMLELDLHVETFDRAKSTHPL